MRKIKLLLVAFIALFGASSVFADIPVPKASALATDGETIQYLYNVDAKAFIVGANDWNTRASFSPNEGHQFKVKDNGNGTFTLNDWVARDNIWSSMDCQGSDNLWVDGAGRAGDGMFNIAFNADGTFTISNTNVAGFLSVLPSKNDTKLYMSSDAEAQSTWIAVSEEDYAEWLVSYAEWQELISKFTVPIIDQKFTSIDDLLDGTLFSIINEDEEKAFYNINNQNLAYDTFENAKKGTSYLFKLESQADKDDEEVKNCYALQVVKEDGSSVGLWGNSKIYLNSGTCADGGFNGCFVLGNGNQFGTDLKYGGVWEIEYEEGKGFALKNKAHGGYFVGVNPGPTGTDPIYWTFGTFTTILDAYNKALKDAKAMATMFADDALTEALETYAFENVINEEATEESVAAATEALLAAMEYKLSQYYSDFEAGQYYVIDVETGLKMAAGHDHGTRGIVNELGLDLTLTPNAEKHSVTFDTQVYYNGSHFLGSNLFMDAAAYGWYLDYQGFGFYITNGLQYINIDEENNLVMSDTPREWFIMTAEALKAQRLEEMAEATAEAPVDATFLIQGANFNRNDARNNTWEQWSENAEGGTNFTISGGNETNNCAESFHAQFYVQQTINDAPAGIYKLTAQGFYRQDGSDNDNLPVFFVNDKTATFPVKTGSENSMSDASESFTNDLYTIEPIIFEVGDDGVITLGAKLENNTALWCIWDNFELTYYGSDVTGLEVKEAKESYQKALAAAQKVDQSAIEIEAVKTALADALTTYAEDKVLTADATKESIEAATAALATATDAATASVIAASILPKMLAFTETTNVYTQEAFDAYYTQYYDKYVAGTLTAAEARGLQDPNPTTGWHAAITVDNFLLSVWDTNPDFVDAPYYINTWSVEGDNDGTNFHVPFFEYWTQDANSLGERTLTATMTDLPNGTYSVSAWVRVRTKDEAGADTEAYGITLQVNEGAAVDVTKGETKIAIEDKNNNFFLEDAIANGDVTDGTLKIKFNVAADNNISWLSFKNVKFEKVGDPTKIAGVSEKASQNAIFNVAGQQMNGLQKGLNIVGGKKVYIK